MKLALISFFLLAHIMSIIAYSGWHSTISEGCPKGMHFLPVIVVFWSFWFRILHNLEFWLHFDTDIPVHLQIND